jgi:uncharacterized membrane protein
MKKENSELIQVITFLVVVLAQVFLAMRYYTREDMVGTAVFAVVAVLALAAAFGHFLAWRELRRK